MMRKRCLPLLLLCLLSVSCLQTENSSSSDGGFAGENNNSPEFEAARLVFSQSCTGCHSFHAQSEAQLIASGEVLPGDAENSPVYYRMQGSTGLNGSKNMPQNGSISTTDVETVATWINGITP
jgi:mono/diheme cytochrome c family protein